MKVLISGGAGFIGSHVAENLRSGSHSVMIVDDFSTGRMENILPFLSGGGKYTQSDICLAEGDISSFTTVMKIFQDFKPDAVIHLAAQAAISTSMANPQHDLTINGIGTLNMLQAAKKHGVKHFVISSTSAVYRESKYFKTKEDAPLEPNTPYGVSKLAAEMYVRSMFPGAVVLRFGNVYGPRQVPIGENQVIARMMRHLLYGDKFVINGDGKQERDYVYVTDVAQAVTYALYGEPGTYNVSTGKCISVNELATIVENHFGIPGYKWEHTIENDPRRRACLENNAAQKGLGWKPQVSIVVGIKKTAEWWEKRGQS
jgi:UDP-glucose 4-epimerase